MRHLVACPGCGRQYDAGAMAPDDRFHCACGRVLRVPPRESHDAAVVRCSSCGAARREGAPACGFCAADFTLHEQDLHTVCPKCLARISDRARYCHHCATPILSAGSAGSPSDTSCPCCGKPRTLSSRGLGEPAVSVLECPRCAGLWLSRDAFQVLRERAQDVAAADPSEMPERSQGTTSSGAAPTSSGVAPTSSGAASPPTYRPCPECDKLMHRVNYARKSGVIVDSCRRHGLWFDAQELDAVLRWIRSGGEAQARRLENQEERERMRFERMKRHLEPVEAGWDAPGYDVATLGRWLTRVLGALFDLR